MSAARDLFVLSPAALAPVNRHEQPLSLLPQRYWPAIELRVSNLVANSLEPAGDIMPDEWAELSIVISPRVSKRPGLIRLFSYQRKPLQAIKYSERVVCCFGTQTGKTIIIQCGLGYFIDQAPGPCMVAYPNQKLCMKRSKKHLKPMITDSPVLASHLPGTPDDLLSFSYSFDRMDVSIAWAGSPADLSSEPIRYLIRDEIGKFPGATATEGDAMSLSERRTGSYSFQRRILDVTTPTLPHAPGWRDLMGGTYNEFYVRCPECTMPQVLRFSAFVIPNREPGENEHVWKRRVLEDTALECTNEECKHHMNTLEKNHAVQRGEWVPNNPEALYESFHLPRWYSLDVKLGEVALNYIDSRDDIGKMKDFINSDCAEPWRDSGANTSVERVLAHSADYEHDLLPIKNEVLILMFVDVQQNYFWYNTWALTKTTSYLLNFGTVADWEQLDVLREASYLNTESKEQYVRQTFIDARYRTREVYEYCVARPFVTPLMGCNDLNRRMTQLIRWGNVSKYPGSNRKLARVIQRMDINAAEFAEEALVWLNSGFEDENTPVKDYDSQESKFFLPRHTTEEYAKHLTRRKKTSRTDQYGRELTVWVDTHKRHDYFDLFVYMLAARFYYSKELQELRETVILEN